jgi:hypothetical protein
MNLWISFEDPKSAAKKVEYVKRNNLGGVSIWSLDMDDSKGTFCKVGLFPIITAIKNQFESDKTINIKNNNNNNNFLLPTKRRPPLTIFDNDSIQNSSISGQRPGGGTIGGNGNIDPTLTPSITKQNQTDKMNLETFKIKVIRGIEIAVCLDSRKCKLNKNEAKSFHFLSNYSSNKSIFIIFIILILNYALI